MWTWFHHQTATWWFHSCEALKTWAQTFRMKALFYFLYVFQLLTLVCRLAHHSVRKSRSHSSNNGPTSYICRKACGRPEGRPEGCPAVREARAPSHANMPLHFLVRTQTHSSSARFAGGSFVWRGKIRATAVVVMSLVAVAIYDSVFQGGKGNDRHRLRCWVVVINSNASLFLFARPSFLSA